MVRGNVNRKYEAVTRLRLRGSTEVHVEVDAVVDTGFSNWLTLPVSIVNQLGLVTYSQSSFTLADHSEILVDIYSVDVEWDGEFQNVIVSALGEECLIGMQFLEGYELRIQVTPGGLVTAEKI
jgi:clan AA aspartic protease